MSLREIVRSVKQVDGKEFMIANRDTPLLCT